MNNLVEIRNLQKKYPGFCLKDVSFSVPKGYIMGFIGPNGAGKTTTIKAIMGMIHPDGGEIKLMGKSGQPDVKEDIGVVMDSTFFVDDWKVGEVERALSPFYKNWDSDIFKKYITQFNLDEDKKIKELSRGMKMKLMMASALSHHPRLLILDEPTSGLDPVARDEMMEILSDFIADENNCVLFSTHITSDLEKIADYITFIKDGQIVFSGEKDDLLEQYLLVRGNSGSLSQDQKKLVIGYQEHTAGFRGMAKRENVKRLGTDVIGDRITLDEMIVFMNKEDHRK